MFQSFWLFDKSKFYHSACGKGAECRERLYNAGSVFRTMDPKGGCCHIMHCKTVIIDKAVVFAGSVNLTHNGMEHNKEHLFRITDPVIVAKVCADFMRDWRNEGGITSEEVNDEDMEKMLGYRQAKMEKASARKEASAVPRRNVRTGNMKRPSSADGVVRTLVYEMTDMSPDRPMNRPGQASTDRIVDVRPFTPIHEPDEVTTLELFEE